MEKDEIRDVEGSTPDEPSGHNGDSPAAGGLSARQLILIALLAVVVGAALIYYLQEGRRGEPPPEVTDGVTEVPEGNRAVTLYFADDESEGLVTETRLVAIGKEFVEQVEQVVEALLIGPNEDGLSTIAEGTQLLGAFYDAETATLYLDFTGEIVAGHPGGSSAEYFTIAAIVRTVSENFPEVRAVQLLVEGLQIGTIGGHIDAYKPFVVSEWR